MTSGSLLSGSTEKLPDWFPPWAAQLAELYFSGTTSAFVLHGNTYDLVRIGSGDELRYGVLAEFLAEQVFGRWSLVLHYDLGRGLRPLAGRDEQRLKDMVTLTNRKVGDLSALPRDPATAFAGARSSRAPQRHGRGRRSPEPRGDHGSGVVYVFPAGEPGRLNLQASSELVTMLNWAMSPQVKQLNMAFVLVDEKLADLSDRLAGNPHAATIEVPLPNEQERETFIQTSSKGESLKDFSDFEAAGLAKLTAGISLTDLNVLLQSARESGRRLDSLVFRSLKKRLIERQCRGLLEFIEPKWTLDTVVGHEAAKARFRQDAALLKRGVLDSLPMGYLICGPVGTGKSFLAQCVSGEIGVPCVILKNFRSKYVGETEGNLERVLSVLRAMGPVVVVVDEADAALGSREQDGDSGTSSRVFGDDCRADGGTRSIAAGFIWMLLTSRPELLPIDLKRQGRAEVHIPLFYPTDEREVRQMFVILAGKLGSLVSIDDVPPIPAARTSLGRGYRGDRRARVALVAAGRRGSHHGRGSGRSGIAVHAVDAGPRARAAGNSSDSRMHRPAVPAGGDARKHRGRRRARETADEADGAQTDRRGAVVDWHETD